MELGMSDLKIEAMTLEQRELAGCLGRISRSGR